jgi:hypothetical protein
MEIPQVSILDELKSSSTIYLKKCQRSDVPKEWEALHTVDLGMGLDYEKIPAFTKQDLEILWEWDAANHFKYSEFPGGINTFQIQFCLEFPDKEFLNKQVFTHPDWYQRINLLFACLNNISDKYQGQVLDDYLRKLHLKMLSQLMQN